MSRSTTAALSYPQRGPGSTPRWIAAGLAITGFGHYYPERLVRNDVHSYRRPGNVVDTAVLGRVTVSSRHVAGDHESVAFMASHAARAALGHAGLAADDLDLLVVSNWTDPPYLPDHAPQVAELLGATSAFAFDVSAACVGFVHGVQLAAASLVAMPELRYAVVVSSERFSRRARPGSKSELICGDAAGAVVLERTASGRGGLLDSIVRSDGSRADLVTVRTPDAWITSRAELADHAAADMVDACRHVLERSGYTVDDVDWVVPHPGTDAVNERLRDKLGVADERFLVNFHDRGNTASASIPVVLSEFSDAGMFRPEDLVLSPAIGAGWYHGALLFRL
ncbi:ketoacyl-ACP synthase III [Phytoactinopolyspora limicola]|uniref:ketoacyl-ACP synthase III n=1 Tax=Phytoactinopolyspora limicola TaxID=2715536 RepID=UPI001409CA37|nr:ketoacyl-ACP synthase III [Phytoactinopolyspora limicola]